MSRVRRAVIRSTIGTLLLAALALTPAVSASAHDFLVQSTPAAGSVQTAPLSQVSLTFNDVVLSKADLGIGAIVIVTRNGGTRQYETGCASVIDRTVTVPVALGAPGTYRIEWRIVSADGHPVADAIEFTYAPAVGATPAPGSADGPKCGDARTNPTAPTTPATPASVGQTLIIVLIAGGIVLLALAAVAILLLRAGARTNREPAALESDREEGEPSEDAARPDPPR